MRYFASIKHSPWELPYKNSGEGESLGFLKKKKGTLEGTRILFCGRGSNYISPLKKCQF